MKEQVVALHPGSDSITHSPSWCKFAYLSMRAVSASLFFNRIAKNRAVPSDYTRTNKILDELKKIAESYACDVNEKSDELLFNCIEGKYVIVKTLEEEYPGKNPRDSLEGLLSAASKKPEQEAAKELSEFFHKVHDFSEELHVYWNNENIGFYLYRVFGTKE
jgi:hypothetical protein